MNNKDYIDAYKSDDKIITDFYKLNVNGKLVDITGIVNPFRIDNRQLMSPTDNQKATPHCAAYSACTLAESIYWKRTGTLKQFDAHQVYALAKQLDGMEQTEGTRLECSLKAVIQLCAFENFHQIKYGTFWNTRTYKTIDQTKLLIHKYDFLQAGFQIDEGWYDVTNNDFRIKQRGRSLGGHAVCIAGYDQEGVYILNSWGSVWGAKGYAIMPWETYLKELMYGAFVIGAYNID